MSIPSFYKLDSAGFGEKCGTMFRPDCDGATAAGREFGKQNNIKASSHKGADPWVVLAIIDAQVDFCNPKWGNLYVQGAEQDTDRLCKFIFRNPAIISRVVASLDTHYLYQPFHRYNWVAGPNPAQRQDGTHYSEGECPDPFTIIALADLADGKWLPSRMPNRMRQMLELLEKGGKKQLCIWPLHCELGTPGQAIEPALMEALHWHAGARSDQYDLTPKGMSQSAEHFGILKAEAQFSDDPTTQLNTPIVNGWANADRIYFAGQAKSHCVLETLEQVVDIFSKKSPEVLDRLYVLQDCMSSVPDIKDASGNVIVPFNQIAEDRFAEFKKMGLKFVNSTDPITL